jgi:hypothetical protein
MVFDVCERASATEANAKQATEALSREFKCVPADFPRRYSSIYFQSQIRRSSAATLGRMGAPHTIATLKGLILRT